EAAAAIQEAAHRNAPDEPAREIRDGRAERTRLLGVVHRPQQPGTEELLEPPLGDPVLARKTPKRRRVRVRELGMGLLAPAFRGGARRACPRTWPRRIRRVGSSSERLQVAAELVFVDPAGVAVREREGPAGLRVVRVARHDVRVQVRYLVAEDVVVQLDGLQALLDPAPGLENLPPVLRRLVFGELRRLGDVPPAPDHDGIAALDVPLLEVDVRDLAREEAGAVFGLVGAALAAHRAALTLLERVERLWPLHAADVSIGTRSVRDAGTVLRARQRCAADATHRGLGDLPVRG